MARVKRGTIAKKRRKNVLAKTKGYRWGRKSKYRLAKQAVLKAGVYAFRDRKVKKRTRRALWQTNIGAVSKAAGIPYSRLIPLLKKQDIALDRKILAALAQKHPDIFQKILESVRGQS